MTRVFFILVLILAFVGLLSSASSDALKVSQGAQNELSRERIRRAPKVINRRKNSGAFLNHNWMNYVSLEQINALIDSVQLEESSISAYIPSFIKTFIKDLQERSKDMHSTIANAPHLSESVLYKSFKRINFQFKTQDEEDEYINNKHYRNVVPAGIKIGADDDIYVSFPRWKQNVPYTLARYNEEDNLFVPYPSFEMTNGKSAQSLHSVLGFEINPETETMYILDQGTLDGNGNMKLVIWDMRANETLLNYEFDEEEVRFTSSFLNDLVVDTEHHIIFISDSGKPQNESMPLTPAIIRVQLNPEIDEESGIVTYNQESVVVERFLEGHKSVMPIDDYIIGCEDCDSITPTGIDGIALSCDFQRLYWTPMSSNNLYGVDVVYFDFPDYLNNTVVSIGNKKSASDGFICSNNQKLYMTMLESYMISSLDENSIASAVDDLASPAVFPTLTETSNGTKLQWPDTLSIDAHGNLWAMSNNLGKFLKGNMDFENDSNFAIYRFHVGGTSYIIGCIGKGRKVRLLEILVMVSGVAVFTVGLVIVFISSLCAKFIMKKSKHTESYFQQGESIE